MGWCCSMRGLRGVTMVSLMFYGVQCTGPDVTGTATETENVAGIIYKADGTTPAANAKVHLLPVDYNPRQGFALAVAPESTTTDANGVYRLDSVPEGTYNVLAGGGGALAFEDSVTVTGEGKTEVPPATLRRPGSLFGAIEMQPGDDPRTVFVLVMGTYQWTWPDSVGNFMLKDMAEGTYHVRFLTTLDNYMVLDTVLSLTAGSVDTIDHPIRMRFTGIPVIAGPSLAYDTLRQLVTLRWNRQTAGRPSGGYTVYRRQGSSTLEKYAAEVKDTFLVDGNVIQDSTYEYRIALLDTNGTEGVKSPAVSTVIASGFVLVETLGEGTGTNGWSAMAVDPRTGEIYCPGYCTDMNSRCIQKLDSTGRLLTSWEYQGIDDGWGPAPGLAVDSAGNLLIPNFSQGTIDRFTADGTPLAFWKDGFRSPLSIVIEGSYLCVGEFKQAVKIFRLGDTLALPVELPFMMAGIAVIDTVLYVATFEDELIVAFDVRNGVVIDTLLDARNYSSRWNCYIWGFKNLRRSHDGSALWTASNMQYIYRFDRSGNLSARFSIPDDSPVDLYDDGHAVWIALHGGSIRKYREK